MNRSGILPPINDLIAVLVVLIAYLLRFGHLGGLRAAPWYLSVTTDMILPAMAGAYLFVVALLVTIEHYEADT